MALSTAAQMELRCSEAIWARVAFACDPTRSVGIRMLLRILVTLVFFHFAGASSRISFKKLLGNAEVGTTEWSLESRTPEKATLAAMGAVEANLPEGLVGKLSVIGDAVVRPVRLVVCMRYCDASQRAKGNDIAETTGVHEKWVVSIAVAECRHELAISLTTVARAADEGLQVSVDSHHVYRDVPA